MFGNQSTQYTEKVGKEIVEGAKSHSRDKVREKWQPLVEDLEQKEEAISDDTDLYTTLQASIVEQALEPTLLGLDAIRTLDFEVGRGVDSIKIPSGNRLTAVELNSDGSLSEDTTGWDSKSVNIQWFGVRTTFATQLLDKSRVDLLALRMEQAGRALARKVDERIVTEIEKAGTKDDADYGDNGNYLYLGSSGTVTYDDMVNALSQAGDNNAAVDMALLNHTSWKNLMQDQDMKDALAFGTTTEGDVPLVQQFGELRIARSGQISTNKILLVDTSKTGFYVDAGDVRTYDGRVSEAAQFEVLAVKPFGVGIVQPKSVFVVHEQADEPT